MLSSILVAPSLNALFITGITSFIYFNCIY